MDVREAIELAYFYSYQALAAIRHEACLVFGDVVELWANLEDKARAEPVKLDDKR